MYRRIRHSQQVRAIRGLNHIVPAMLCKGSHARSFDPLLEGRRGIRCYSVGVAFAGILHSWLCALSGIRLFITIRLNHHAHVKVILYRVVHFVLVEAAFELRCLHEDGLIRQKHIVQVIVFVVKLECGIKLLLWCCEIERLAKPRANC